MPALDPALLAPDPEIAELAQDFLEAQRSPRTRRSYRTDLALFFKWLGERELHPLNAARPDIDRFRNYLAELVGPDGKPSPSGRPRFAPTTVSPPSRDRPLVLWLPDRASGAARLPGREHQRPTPESRPEGPRYDRGAVKGAARRRRHP
jgi:Phage integrase, N-terminal SAM-like domain